MKNRPNVHQIRTILTRRDHQNTRVHIERGYDGKDHVFVDIRTPGATKKERITQVRAVLRTLQMVGLYVHQKGAQLDAIHCGDRRKLDGGFYVEIPPDWHGPRNWPLWLNQAREAGRARSWGDTLTIMYGG